MELWEKSGGFTPSPVSTYGAYQYILKEHFKVRSAEDLEAWTRHENTTGELTIYHSEEGRLVQKSNDPASLLPRPGNAATRLIVLSYQSWDTLDPWLLTRSVTRRTPSTLVKAGIPVPPDYTDNEAD